MLNDVLERIYREANGIPDGKRAPLTTESVFKAMRAAMAKQRMACADEIERVSGETYAVVLYEHKEAADWLRSNAGVQGPAASFAG